MGEAPRETPSAPARATLAHAVHLLDVEPRSKQLPIKRLELVGCDARLWRADETGRTARQQHPHGVARLNLFHKAIERGGSRDRSGARLWMIAHDGQERRTGCRHLVWRDDESAGEG